MKVNNVYAEFEVVRDFSRCINCRLCEKQCANGVHCYSAEKKTMLADDSKCVNCHRCVAVCPARALKIVKSELTFRGNANWPDEVIKQVYRQSETGGVLLSSMGNPKEGPIYWDKMLVNASQVTNPSIDPLREPMETRTYLGKKPQRMERNPDGSLRLEHTPGLELSTPILFSAMSYGSISYNAHAALARAAKRCV